MTARTMAADAELAHAGLGHDPHHKVDWQKVMDTTTRAAVSAEADRNRVKVTFNEDFTPIDARTALGLSVGRTAGLGGYSGPSGGRMSTSMTGFYPWVGYQVNDKVSVWGVSGYGTGALSLTPDGASALETGVSMAMTAVGTRGELIGSRATGGFALAFKADAMWVGAASDLLDGPSGRLNASEVAVDAGAHGAGGLPGLHAGRPAVADAGRRGGAAAGRRRRRDGRGHGRGRRARVQRQGHGAVARCAGADAGGASGRRVLRARNVAVAGVGPDAVEPAASERAGGPVVGRPVAGGESLWCNQMAYGMGSHQMYGSGGQVAAEVGYGLPLGARLVGTPRV